MLDPPSALLASYARSVFIAAEEAISAISAGDEADPELAAGRRAGIAPIATLPTRFLFTGEGAEGGVGLSGVGIFPVSFMRPAAAGGGAKGCCGGSLPSFCVRPSCDLSICFK